MNAKRNIYVMMTPLKKVLFEIEKSNRWLAKEVGADETGISLIVNGKRIPSLLMSMRIAQVIGVSVEELWGHLLEG